MPSSQNLTSVVGIVPFIVVPLNHDKCQNNTTLTLTLTQQYEDFVYSCLVIRTKNVSDIINKNSFVTSAIKQNGRTTDLNIAKMKDTNSDKLRAAATGQRYETEALFSSEFIFFIQSV